MFEVVTTSSTTMDSNFTRVSEERRRGFRCRSMHCRSGANGMRYGTAGRCPQSPVSDKLSGIHGELEIMRILDVPQVAEHSRAL